MSHPIWRYTVYGASHARTVYVKKRVRHSRKNDNDTPTMSSALGGKQDHLLISGCGVSVP